MGRAGTEPKLTEFKGFPCRLEPRVEWSCRARGSIGCPQPRGTLAELLVGPSCLLTVPWGSCLSAGLGCPPSPPGFLPPGRAFWDGSRSQPRLSQLRVPELSKVGAELVQQPRQLQQLS